MREILFRGKSVNGTGWFEGSLRIVTIQPADKEAFKQYEIEDTTLGVFPNDFMAGFCEIVVPETVGQFTGLTDKNGKKIFEGDIIRATDSQDADLVGMVVWRYEAWCVSGANWADTLHMANFLHKLVVIGNIHDNPELLNGGFEDEK